MQDNRLRKIVLSKSAKKFLMRVLMCFNAIAITRKEQFIKQKKSIGEPLKIIFLVQFPEMWNSLKTVFEYMNNDSRFDVQIVCVPKKRGEKISEYSNNNDALNFFKKQQIDALSAFEEGVWLDIKKLKPDYIILQRPYDVYMPKCYSLKNLFQIALLVYIPYSERITKGVHLEIEFNNRALTYIYSIYADCKEASEYILRNTYSLVLKKRRKVFNIGYPRFDLIKRDITNNRKKTVLWTPRWAVSDGNEKSTFFDYYEPLMEFFEKNKDIQLIIRPHPLMFVTFVENGLLTVNELNQILERIDSKPNISFDKNEDYLITMGMTDIFFADPSSLLYEFFLSGKPIIYGYCGPVNEEDYTETGKMMSSTFYRIKNGEELKQKLSELLSGGDTQEEVRKDLIGKILPRNTIAGQNIADSIYNDLANT